MYFVHLKLLLRTHKMSLHGHAKEIRLGKIELRKKCFGLLTFNAVDLTNDMFFYKRRVTT